MCTGRFCTIKGYPVVGKAEYERSEFLWKESIKMNENFCKGFVILFCTLLLLQETHSLLKVYLRGEKREQRNDKFEDGQVEKNEISALKSRRKRCILKFVFIFDHFNTKRLKGKKPFSIATCNCKSVLQRLNSCIWSVIFILAQKMKLQRHIKNSVKCLICDALPDLVPFVQFKKREKHPPRSKVAGWSLQLS